MYNKLKIMEKYLIYFLSGFLGGVIRGLVGFVKNKTIEKANHFKTSYFLITILISGVVGAAAGILADTEWQVSFLAGYAGTDFIENLYKIKFLKTKRE
jgi:fluoride ion exporter CrcB/FEX